MSGRRWRPNRPVGLLLLFTVGLGTLAWWRVPLVEGPAPIGIRRTEALRVDINQADAATFQLLEGVGPVLAWRIVKWRDQHGPFSALEELVRIPGISHRMVTHNRRLLHCSPVPACDSPVKRNRDGAPRSPGTALGGPPAESAVSPAIGGTDPS